MSSILNNSKNIRVLRQSGGGDSTPLSINVLANPETKALVGQVTETYYFLMKSIVNVEAEMALSCISYNLRRAMNILSVNGMMLQMA